MGKVFQDDNCFCSRVFILMSHFFCCIQWICIHNDQACFQTCKNGYWKLKQVGHLKRNSISFFEVRIVLKMPNKCIDVGRNIIEANFDIHVFIRSFIAKAFNRLIKNFNKVVVSIKLYCFWNLRRVGFKPWEITHIFLFIF